jgi:hypothetical protein
MPDPKRKRAGVRFRLAFGPNCCFDL